MSAGAPGRPLVALHEAEVDYGDARVLGPVSLALAAGEAVAVIGPSGCGKSTALRLLAGLEAPTRGRAERALAARETAVVFQAPTLAPWLDALANVALPLRLAGVPPEAARSRAEAALAAVGLGGAERKKPAQLSGGMAMRVAIARAGVVRPRLLLMDEPFAALDEITRRRLADDTLALVAEAGPALVFVTHNVEEAVYMARRTVVLAGSPGRIVGEVELDGPLPRPPGFRLEPAFREAAERASALLEAGA